MIFSRFLALSKLLLEKDKRVETLLVIGFNPSHTNINSGLLIYICKIFM